MPATSTLDHDARPATPEKPRSGERQADKDAAEPVGKCPQSLDEQDAPGVGSEPQPPRPTARRTGHPASGAEDVEGLVDRIPLSVWAPGSVSNVSTGQAQRVNNSDPARVATVTKSRRCHGSNHDHVRRAGQRQRSHDAAGVTIHHHECAAVRRAVEATASDPQPCGPATGTSINSRSRAAGSIRRSLPGRECWRTRVALHVVCGPPRPSGRAISASTRIESILMTETAQLLLSGSPRLKLNRRLGGSRS